MGVRVFAARQRGSLHADLDHHDVVRRLHALPIAKRYLLHREEMEAPSGYGVDPKHPPVGIDPLCAPSLGQVKTWQFEWYRSLGELARGLRKNAFAGAQYSVALVLGGIVANVALCVWPFAAVWLTTGVERAWYVAAVVPQMIAYAGAARAHHNRPWLALLYPVGAMAFVAIFAAAVTRTFARGGIEWRGTFYPLRELRANRV